MMPLDYVLNYIKLRIPRQVLEIAFIKKDIADDNTTLDDKIIRNVINQHVRPDLDMLGGVVLNIDLHRCNIKPVHGYNEYIIEVPKALTDNCSIIAALHMSSQYMYATQREYVQGRSDSGVMSLANRMLNHLEPQPVVNTARIEVIGDNIIAVHEPLTKQFYTTLQVIIENKENFSNINPQYYSDFAEVCLNATKMYIHTNTIIDLNMGYIQNGHEISEIKDIIADYKDAFERYEELKLTWKKIAVLNDKHRMQKLVKMTIGRMI